MGFGPRAPFNLLRPALEPSLWALWLLDPRDSATRRQRALQYEIHDFKAEISYFEELGKVPDSLLVREAIAERRAHGGHTYREEAEQMGLNYHDLKQARIKLLEEIPKTQHLSARFDKYLVRIIVAEWRRLSGYQPGKTWSTSFGPHQSFLAEVPGGEAFDSWHQTAPSASRHA